jgi:hypothetical protein
MELITIIFKCSVAWKRNLVNENIGDCLNMIPNLYDYPTSDVRETV